MKVKVFLSLVHDTQINLQIIFCLNYVTLKHLWCIPFEVMKACNFADNKLPQITFEILEK